MSYNICFTLGDPSGDGHANTSEYHIVATHSVEEITNAYKKTTELLGFDFVKEVGSEYEADGWIPQEYTKKLLELNIIDDPNGFEQDKLGYLNIRSLQAEAEIETDFEKLYFISSEFDDPLSLDNCATASALVKNGGFYLKNKSNGERQLQSLSKWIHENKADWNEKCLLVFDEVDKGFDLRYQVGLHNMLTNLPVMHGVKILAVSHTLIPMLLEDKVYAFKYRIMLSPSTYVALETGYSIKINDYNEREEV